MNILAAQSAESTCPIANCEGHLFPDATAHVSTAETVELTAGPEQHTAFVSLELEDKPSATPAVRLIGCGDAPMQPEQAIALAQLLIEQATLALTAWKVQR